MLGDLKRFYKNVRSKTTYQENANAEKNEIKIPIPGDINTVERQLLDMIGETSDFIIKKIPGGNGPAVLIACIEGLSDKNLLDRDILEPVMAYHNDPQSAQKQFTEYLKDKLINICSTKETADLAEAALSILSGDALIFTDGLQTALTIGIQKWEKRAPNEPITGAVLRGPREGFVESIGINKSMLRRKIINTSLKFERFIIGEQTRTKVDLCYIKGIANEQIVDEIRKRLLNIKADVILESAYIEQFIEDAPFSLFATVGNTERPDIAASKLLEGRVAILCDGTPFVLTVPHLFVENLQAGDDYYSRPATSLFNRIIRFIGLLMTVYLPALYESFTSFHQGAIEFKLLVTIYSARVNVPFNVTISCLFVLLLFSLIKESATLLPRTVSLSVSVVGGVVVGQALVMAGFVSVITVIVISITVITGYVVPGLEKPIIVMRVFMLLGATMVGNLGIILVSILLYAYTCSLKSIGIPYLSPIAPLSGYDIKDVFFSFPVWAIFRKPETITKRFVANHRQKGG
jgi:Bacillus/Clostridium GerA spore germination protein.